MIVNKHTCITDDGGTPNRKCYACKEEKLSLEIDSLLTAIGINQSLDLTKNEIGLLLEFLSDQFISYENVPLLKLVREMREWYDNQ